MTIFQIINLCLGIPAVILAVSMVVFGISALRKKQITEFSVEYQRKFAIVLLSCNDEETITKTLYSLNNLVYPKNLYDVIFFTSDYNSRLAQTARNLGAIVVEQKNNESHIRSTFLHQIVEALSNWEKGYEAAVFLEKGGLISGNYLEAMNYHLENGSKVIQSSYLRFPVSVNWVEKVKYVFFLLENFVISNGRNVLHRNVLLRGNGMCFSMELLDRLHHERIKFDSYNELTLKLLKGGVKVSFSAEARVWSPLNQKRYLKNNGIVEQTRRFGKSIIPAFRYLFRNASVLKFSGVWFFESIPIFKVLFIESLFFIGINWVLYGRMVFSRAEFWLWICTILASTLLFIIGFFIAEKHKSLRESVLYMPLMCIWVLVSFQLEPFLDILI